MEALLIIGGTLAIGFVLGVAAVIAAVQWLGDDPDDL